VLERRSFQRLSAAVAVMKRSIAVVAAGRGLTMLWVFATAQVRPIKCRTIPRSYTAMVSTLSNVEWRGGREGGELRLLVVRKSEGKSY